MKQNDVVFYIPYPPTKKGKTAWNKRFGLNAYWSGKHYVEDLTGTDVSKYSYELNFLPEMIPGVKITSSD